MKKIKTLNILLLLIAVVSCNTNKNEVNDKNAQEMQEFKGFPLVYEAENARLIKGARVSMNIQEYSGTGYVEGFEKEGAAVEFSVYIPTEGFHDLNFITSTGNNGHKENYVIVDGTPAGTVIVENVAFTDSILRRVYLTKGSHKITYNKFWGWVYLDKLEINPSQPLDPQMYNVPANLVNPNASASARKLMTLLSQLYGKYILTGQYCDRGVNGAEFNVIRQITGCTPSVLGLDMMDYSPSRVTHGSSSSSVEYAIEFHKLGGIVTICWHWNAPEKYLTGTWYRGFYTDQTNINLRQILNGQDKGGIELLMRDIDAIAVQLKRLQEADVPVLWRPLHEASGGWFWWGASGSQAQIELWRIMYDRLTNYHKLNNLIWLWNGQNSDWYPGDEYVDMIGEDIYSGERVYSSGIERFLQAADYAGTPKMVALSENGTLFDPDLAVRDGAWWSFFAVWNGDFVLKSSSPLKYSERYTELKMLKHAYDSEHTLTLEDLQKWK